MDLIDLQPIQSFDLAGNDAPALNLSEPLSFDLFIHMPLNQRYLLYRRKGQKMTDQHRAKLAEHNIEGFFVRKSDYNLFVQHVARRLRGILALKPGERDQSARLAARSLMRSALTAEDPMLAQAMMGNLYEITANIIESVLENSNLGSKQAFRTLVDLAQTGSSLQRHPVNVAALAVILAYGIGYTSEKTLYYLAVAALVHDIGLTRLPARISELAHDPEGLTAAERTELHQHPQLALEILRERGLKLPPPILMIIQQHHELASGKGYPLGLRGNQISELTQIMQVADEIDDRLLSVQTGSSQLKLRLHYFFEKMNDERRIGPVLLNRVRSVIL